MSITISIAEMITNRFSAVELVGKMANPQFSRKARSADFVMHAWETLRAADGDLGDRILGTTLDVFALLVSRDQRDLIDLASRGNLVLALLERLAAMTRKTDPLCILNGAESDAELRQRGFGRTDKLPVRFLFANFSVTNITHKPVQLSTLNKVVIGSSIFPEGTPVRSSFSQHPQDRRLNLSQISNRLLITCSLSSLPASLLNSSQVATVSLVLRSELSLIPPRLTGYLTGLPLLPQSRTDFSAPSFACVEGCLRLLESYLLGRWGHKGMDDEVPPCEALDPNRDEIIEGLLACSLATDILIRETRDEDAASQSEYLRS